MILTQACQFLTLLFTAQNVFGSRQSAFFGKDVRKTERSVEGALNRSDR